ncbi:MAG: transglutaminase domain-containing protein [Armatimonadota bacterium]|nr:transglutaminase domain-containing protein [Armatimonadota bacterium]
MRRIAGLITPLAIVLACALAPAWSQSEPVSTDSRETWMGVYVGDQKIGYLRASSARVKYEGRDAFRLDDLLHTKLKMFGVEMLQDITNVIYTDLNLKPIFEEFQMSSGGARTRVEAVFQPDVIKCKLISEGTTTDKDIPIPPGTNLMGNSSFYDIADRKLVVGDKFAFDLFYPPSLAIGAVSMEVLRQEKVTLKDKTYDTYVVKSATPMGDITSWLEENGEAVKMVALMGMMMVRESKEEAMGDEAGYQPPSDFAVLTSVKANIDLRKPSRIRYLKLGLSGMADSKLIISDGRQKVTWSSKVGKPAAQFAITARRTDGKSSALLPFRSADLRPYLTEAPYIQSNDPSIRQMALSIVGKEKRSYLAAAKIRKWVHGHMQMQANMGIVRSAVDVMKNRAGVCRDYAVLYTALARAAGIPTKFVAGLVFFEGSFYYHAWAESYTGEWTPFDATLATDFVDATHVKLTQGDATSMFDIAKVIGGLKARIYDYRYLEK